MTAVVRQPMRVPPRVVQRGGEEYLRTIHFQGIKIRKLLRYFSQNFLLEMGGEGEDLGGAEFGHGAEGVV